MTPRTRIPRRAGPGLALALTTILAVPTLGACGDDTGGDMATAGDMAMTPDAGGGDGGCVAAPEDVSACKPLPTDYRPRTNMSKDDPWPACITDDNTYHLVGTAIPGSAARVVAWEAIGDRLWRNPRAPSVDDFVEARTQYALPNGIGSRIERRQDIHYPDIPNNNKTRCSEQGVPQMYPDRCAGPARLVPLINDAFQKGIAGTEPRVQAARVEAALLWFFYLSTLSEQWTCSFEAPDDCDGVWSHYNGARPRGELSGIARYIRPLGPETEDRIFDGILAIRCWRDLDRALPSTNAELYARSMAQLDRAEQRGLALIVRDRIGRLACGSTDERKAHLAFVGIIGGFLDRAARAIDPARADALRAQVMAASPEQVDIAKAQAALDALFPCP